MQECRANKLGVVPPRSTVLGAGCPSVLKVGWVCRLMGGRSDPWKKGDELLNHSTIDRHGYVSHGTAGRGWGI